MANDISNVPSGQPLLIMTFGMHYCGVFAGCRDGYVMLHDARLISEVGPMVPFTEGRAVSGQGGHHSEPIYDDADGPVYSVPLDVIQSYGPIKKLPKR